MSRIGKKPITIPAGVEVKIEDGNKVTVEESPDGNCMDTSNAKTFNYEISGFDLNLK